MESEAGREVIEKEDERTGRRKKDVVSPYKKEGMYKMYVRLITGSIDTLKLRLD
jgi:hypothetical protein